MEGICIVPLTLLQRKESFCNILNDSETGFANMDSTITRLEAMSALFKAENPVTDTLSEDSEFREAVDAGNTNEYTIFASNLSEQSYLDISSGSLDSHTANGTITRGELVYMIVQEYFKTEYDNVDIKGECYADTVNGGNIAVAQKFIEGENKKEHWQSYELSYALQNPDKGCPERMYKALLVANEKGIIVDKDSRWEEGATKEDFLEMLTNAYLALPSQVSAERGTGEAPIQSEEPTTETSDNLAVDVEGTDGVIEDGDYDEEVTPQVEEDTSKEQQETTKVEFTEERYQYFSKMMQEDPENKTGWQDDYSYDEVVEYITRDVMKDYMPSGGSSGHIDAPAPEGSAPSNASEIGNEPMQLTDHPEGADVQIQ